MRLFSGSKAGNPHNASGVWSWPPWQRPTSRCSGTEGGRQETLQKYATVLNALTEWASRRGIRRPMAFGDTEFWAFHQTMVDRGLAPKTRYGDLTVVKQLFKWAARTRRIPYNPLADATLESPPATLQPCFSPNQVGALLESADQLERPVFALMAYAGLRFGEVRDLRWADLLTDKGRYGFLTVRRGGSRGTTKSKRIRVIPIHPALRIMLDMLPRVSDRVVAAGPSRRNPTGGGPINERHLLGLLKRLCARCGLPNPNQYKLHTFRHTFASMCARNNVSYKYALEWMGHTSSEILDIYYTMYDDTAQEAIETLEYPARATAPPMLDAWRKALSRGLVHDN